MSVPISAMSRRETLAGGGGRERLNSAAITAAIRPFTVVSRSVCKTA